MLNDGSYFADPAGYLVGNNSWGGQSYLNPGDYYTFSFSEPGLYVVTGMDEYGNWMHYFFEV